MLKDFFRNKPHSHQRDDFSRKFILPSKWIPPCSGISEQTKLTIQTITPETSKTLNLTSMGQGSHKRIINKHTGYNLSKDESVALTELKTNYHIIIKQADKGGAIVIMDRDLYIAEALRQLNNPNYYKLITEPMYTESASLITTQLNNLLNKGYINDKQFAYLSPPSDLKPRQFYLLPKIHKAHDKWPHPSMPEGRPIVSDINSETYTLSKYIDYYLQPLSTLHEAYIKDTYDFVDKIRDTQIHKNDLLVTGDITALYTNMTIDRILRTVQDMFQAFPDPHRPDEKLLNLLQITLTRNDFAFGLQTFLQICGTAMGKGYAPSLANIYLREFDRAAKYGFHIKPKTYWLFLDDIHLVWPGSAHELQQYEQYLNSIIPGITVTLIAKHNITEFLDTRTYKHITAEGTC